MNDKLKATGPEGEAIKLPTLEDGHDFKKAKERHQQAGEIMDALIQIEAFRLDALARMKKALPGSEDHSAAASALSVLSNRRTKARKNYAAYFQTIINLIK